MEKNDIKLGTRLGPEYTLLFLCSETWLQFKCTAELIIKGDKLEKNQSTSRPFTVKKLTFCCPVFKESLMLKQR